MSYTAEELVDAYLNVRSAREDLEKQYSAQDAELKKDLSTIEVELLKICNDIDANSINTSRGTVMRKLNERYFCSDWDNFYKFVMEHQAPQLLEKRIHQGNFKEFYASLDQMPPGVNVMREYGITVRKSSK